MAKLRGKGCALQQTIASVLTDVAQILSLDMSGEKSEDYDSSTLDQALHYKTKELTGYSDPGTAKVDLFFDPALAGHKAIVNLIDGVGFTPIAPQTVVWKIKYSDAGPSSITFTGVGHSLDVKVVQNDGIKATLTMNRTSSPTRA